MRRIFIISIYIICFCFSLTAKETSEETKNSNTIGATVSLMSETLTHPGFYAGVEYIPLQNRHNQLLLSMNVGTAVHFRNNIFLFTTVETGYRYIFRRGFMLDIQAGIGYKHSWLSSFPDTVIYERNFDGQIKEAVNHGYSYLLLSQMIGVGWDLSKSTEASMLLFLRTGVAEEYPYNNLIVPRIIISLGATYYISQN